MACLHDCFYIVWIIIAAADNNKILQAAGNKQMSILNETQVTRAHKRAFARIGQARIECGLGTLWIIPVAVRGTFSLNPNLTDVVRRTKQPRLRINDDHLQLKRSTTSDNVDSVFGFAAGGNYPVLLKRVGVDRFHYRVGRYRAGRDK